MPIKEVLENIRKRYSNAGYSTERDRGTAFEELMIKFFQTDSLYSTEYKNILSVCLKK